MASGFDPKSTVPVVSGGRRRPELEQTCIRRDDRSAKLKHHAPVKIQPENAVLRFTRRVRQSGLISSA